MSYRVFLYKIVRSNIQKYSLFLLSAIFSMTVFFVFTNLWYTDGFKEHTNSQMHLLMMIGMIITILFSAFIISYVHWYMMKDRMKSFSVLISYGMTYLDILRLICLETLMIYAVSLGVAYLTGALFSRLFFMISAKLLSIDSISYQLTVQSFLVTALIFMAIFAGVTGISLLQIIRKDLVELSKLKKNVELKGRGNIVVGMAALIILCASLTALYLHNQNSFKDMGIWILGSAVIDLICLYLVISHFSRIIYGRLKKNTGKYYKNLLAASEFAMGYRQNRKTLFVMALLTFGIILFTSITYTLHQESYHLTETENPNDLYFQENQKVSPVDMNAIRKILQESGIEVKDSFKLPYIYMEAPQLNAINEQRYHKNLPITNVTVFNEIFQTDYQIAEGEVVQIIFESGKNGNRPVFLGRDITLKSDDNSFQLTGKDVIYRKILNRYLFPQPVILIVNTADYQQFEKNAQDIERGCLYIYDFKDWKKSGELCDRISDQIYTGYDNASMTDPEAFREMVSRYGYSQVSVLSRTIYYKITRMQGSYSLFIMGFISILFAFCIIITYYFKVFMGAEEDAQRFMKLNGIGLTKEEMEKLITIRIRLLMFVPSIFGVILGICWCYAFNLPRLIEIELSNLVIFRNSMIVSGIFLAVIAVDYLAVKGSYLKRLRLNEE